MERFMREFTKLNGEKAEVLLEHCLFDSQVFYCEKLQVINDNKRIGLILKGQEIFVYKQDIKNIYINNNTYIISDDRFIITVCVNKL